MGEGPYRYVWVVDFPMFDGVDDDGHPVPPTTRSRCPTPTTSTLLAADPAAVRSQAYDLVLNGWELGSGSVRIHRGDIQSQVFDALGISDDEADVPLRLPARRLPATGRRRTPASPFGIDRLVAILAGEENIREVIAFPKTQSGADPLTGAPEGARPGRPGRARASASPRDPGR